MCSTGMMPVELWGGNGKVVSKSIHIHRYEADLYQRHELAAYLQCDADLPREYLGEWRGRLKVVKSSNSRGLLFWFHDISHDTGGVHEDKLL